MNLVYSLGNSWKSSIIKIYNFSLNLINEFTGGVNGVEIFTIGKITLGKFNGMQLAGISVVKGRFKGDQLGLLINVNLSSSQGFQLAGLWTHNQGDFTGFQFSWFGNTIWGNVHGVQLSHLWNLSQKNMYGIQFALGPSTARKNAYEIQFSATMNYAAIKHEGLQFAFFG